MNHISQDKNLSQPRNRFYKKPWLAILFLTIILILLIEGISQCALWVRDSLQFTSDPKENYIIELRKKENVDSRLMVEELQYLYQDAVEFHPYRWYKLPANYEGKYFQTESLGYRFRSTEAKTKRPLIGCYGGSTMFSLYTKQEGSIPALFNSLNLLPDSLYALNFGIGAYGSSTELISFIESTRKYPIQQAIFMDGVNEVVRYLDRFMSYRDEEIYDYWNFPFSGPLPYGFMNTLNNNPSEFEMYKIEPFRPATYWVSKSILGKIKKVLPADNSSINTHEEYGWKDEDYRKAGEIAAKIYMANIFDIHAIAKAKGIKTYFILQPTLFTTKKDLNDWEKSFRDNNHPYLAAIHSYTYKYIKEAKKGELNFIDLTDGWDDLPPGDYLYDWHHVNEKGNEHLARKIAEKITVFDN
jgi:hypothetical protein